MDLIGAREALEVGEYSKVEKACRQMLVDISGATAKAEEAREVKSLLIDAMIGLQQDEESSEPIIGLLDSLFVDYLAARNRLAAAKTLIRIMEFLDNEDTGRAIEFGLKLIGLFESSADLEILEVVREAYFFVWERIGENDPGLERFSTQFGLFLECPAVSNPFMILEIDDFLDGSANATAIQIINSFLNARSEDLSDGTREMLIARLATNHLFVGNYTAAIELCTQLLTTHAIGDSHYDYLLWCGEAFLKLDRQETAAVYFHGIVNALAASPDDSRAKSAQSFLTMISSEI